jgi:hypothetical protein
MLLKARFAFLTDKVLIAACLLCVFVISTQAGKRQGFLSAMVFMGVGLSIRIGNPAHALLRLLNIRRRGIVTAMISWGLLVGLVAAISLYIGTLGRIRIGEREIAWGLDDVISYVQWPLINFEYQCAVLGYGHYVSAANLLTGLVPYKWAEALGTEFVDIEHLEPTASSGFYGQLHRDVGFWGCLIFSFVVGLITKRCFVLSKGSDLFLLIYAHMAWTLLAAHSFNFFFSLVFIALPVFAYSVLFFAMRGERVMGSQSVSVARK